MKRYLSGMVTAIVLATAQQGVAEIVLNAKSVELSDIKIERSESYLNCNFNISLANCELSTNRELRLNPCIVGRDGGVLELPAMIVAGRSRYIYVERTEDLSENLRLYRYKRNMTLAYSVSVPYEEWMEQSRIELREAACGCCSDKLVEYTMTVDSLDFRRRVFEAVPVFIVPAAEAVKMRQLSGRAFVDFPVNRTEIRPDYRGNYAELGKIQASIDSVRNDKDVTITSLTIRGFASPEGPYANNERLAKGRTASLKDYVEQLYRFEPGFIKTSYEPEDWDGLRRYVEQSNLDRRDAMLEVIDSDLLPDARDGRLRSAFPEQYAFLLQNVYPALRHSDYTIDYTVRSYTSAADIIDVMHKRPQNLSLEEFFSAARTLEPGSQTYNDLFETAVRMYPDSEVANLNAAASAIIRGDLVSAERYLEKAGDTPQAIYTRANLAALSGDNEAALGLFEEAAGEGLPEARDAIGRLNEVMKKQKK